MDIADLIGLPLQTFYVVLKLIVIVALAMLLVGAKALIIAGIAAGLVFILLLIALAVGADTDY